MSTPAATMMTAGCLGVGHILLTVSVIMVRRDQGVSMGDGGNALLERRIRAHGNFTEQVPLALVLLLLVEVTGFTRNGYFLLPWVMGGTLILGRLAHGLAFSSLRPSMLGRQGGMMCTITCISILSVVLLVRAVEVLQSKSK